MALLICCERHDLCSRFTAFKLNSLAKLHTNTFPKIPGPTCGRCTRFARPSPLVFAHPLPPCPPIKLLERVWDETRLAVHCTGRNLSRFSAAKTMPCMQCATDIELQVHSYAVGVADIAACEGSPTMCYIHLVITVSSVNAGNWPQCTAKAIACSQRINTKQKIYF